jgi:uracil-DNA glycosylase
MMQLAQKIGILKSEIEQDAKNNNYEAWFYPEYSGVNGFSGTQDIFLVGLNPSSGTFPSKRDKQLYSLLKEKELQNVHITDFIKIRAKNNQINEVLNNSKLIKNQAQFFKKEIDILNPKLLITMGYKCDELIKQNISFSNSFIKKIKHYSFRFQSEDIVFKEISNSLDETKEIYFNL